MTFSDLAPGSSVFLDANVLAYHFQPEPTFGTACTDLVERIERQEIRGFTSTHVLSELSHRLMTLEACQMFGWPFAGIAQRLKTHPAQVCQLTRFRQAIAEVSQYGIRIVTVPPTAVDAAAAVSQQTGLLSNDALIVVLMRTNGLVNLASHDADFDRVAGLQRFTAA